MVTPDSMRLRRSSAAAAYRSAAADGFTLSAQSSGHQQIGLAGHDASIVRARNASMPWVRRRACLAARRPGHQWDAEAGSQQPKTSQQTEQGCMRPSAMLVPIAAATATPAGIEDPEIERNQRVDVSGETKEQAWTAHQVRCRAGLSPASVRAVRANTLRAPRGVASWVVSRSP